MRPLNKNVRKIITAVVLVFSWLPIFSQDSYRVTYEYDNAYFPITINGKKDRIVAMKDKLVFNDTLSFWYRLAGDGDPARKKWVYGSKLIHHAIFYNRNIKLYYSVVAWPIGKKRCLISDSLKSETWVFGNETKTIKGYTCKPAVRVNERNDSTFVWFTPDIPRPFGPFNYMGFPGLVLEIIEQGTTRHIIATKIEKGEFVVTMPAGVPIVTREQFGDPKKR